MAMWSSAKPGNIVHVYEVFEWRVLVESRLCASYTCTCFLYSFLSKTTPTCMLKFDVNKNHKSYNSLKNYIVQKWCMLVHTVETTFTKHNITFCLYISIWKRTWNANFRCKWDKNKKKTIKFFSCSVKLAFWTKLYDVFV